MVPTVTSVGQVKMIAESLSPGTALGEALTLVDELMGMKREAVTAPRTIGSL